MATQEVRVCDVFPGSKDVHETKVVIVRNGATKEITKDLSNRAYARLLAALQPTTKRGT